MQELKWKVQDLWRDRKAWVIGGAAVLVVLTLLVVVLGPVVTAGPGDGAEQAQGSSSTAAPDAACVGRLAELRAETADLDAIATYSALRTSDLAAVCAGVLDLAGDDLEDLMVERVAAAPPQASVRLEDCSSQVRAVRSASPGDEAALRAAYDTGACPRFELVRPLTQRLVTELRGVEAAPSPAAS
jgi:hypothetical protein